MTAFFIFIFGFLNDFMAANWAEAMSRKSYSAGFYAAMWCCVNMTFVLTLVKTLNWIYIPVYAAGIGLGTAAVIALKRRKRNVL